MLKNTVKRSVNGSIHSEEASSGNQASMLVLASIAALFAAYRVFILADHQIPLFYDEAYYHLWSLTLDWGYYSKPPMVAWLIALTTSFAQGVDWLVKLASPVLYCATALIIALTGNQLYNRQTGFWSGALALLMPIVSFNSLFITTDAPLLFFWSLTFYCFVTALATRKLYLWLAAGIACGFGLL
ncbi:MAG: glycosyltransferase family 39 protein, partial [Pseudomonadales bacterium]|nr:glycosyltransferase family 39 protein [Pseudomonadales bacterium]